MHDVLLITGAMGAGKTAVEYALRRHFLPFGMWLEPQPHSHVFNTSTYQRVCFLGPVIGDNCKFAFRGGLDLIDDVWPRNPKSFSAKPSKWVDPPTSDLYIGSLAVDASYPRTAALCVIARRVTEVHIRVSAERNALNLARRTMLSRGVESIAAQRPEHITGRNDPPWLDGSNEHARRIACTAETSIVTVDSAEEAFRTCLEHFAPFATSTFGPYYELAAFRERPNLFGPKQAARLRLEEQSLGKE